MGGEDGKERWRGGGEERERWRGEGGGERGWQGKGEMARKGGERVVRKGERGKRIGKYFSSSLAHYTHI